MRSDADDVCVPEVTLAVRDHQGTGGMQSTVPGEARRGAVNVQRRAASWLTPSGSRRTRTLPRGIDVPVPLCDSPHVCLYDRGGAVLVVNRAHAARVPLRLTLVDAASVRLLTLSTCCNRQQLL
jgi:hypothetical protein